MVGFGRVSKVGAGTTGESMSTPGIQNIIGQGNFNEPATTDNTSVPPMPQMPNPTPAVLASKMKKPRKLKNPGPLAAAISRAKRAGKRATSGEDKSTNFGMAIIGFSLPSQDEYARQVIYRLVTNYQNTNWKEETLEHRKTPLVLIDLPQSTQDRQP
jgi:hypothetical protein